MSGSTCIAPKITVTLKPYHDDNEGTQSAGKFKFLDLGFIFRGALRLPYMISLLY